jgi:hypothetical protein
MVRRVCSFVVVLLLVADGAARAQTASPAGRSPNNASYDIDVKLDPTARTLDGVEIVTWRNIQEKPTKEIWLHLYWNAWRNTHSTWMREVEARGPRRQPDELTDGDWGSVEVRTIGLVPGPDQPPVDLAPSTRPASPDDGNPHDRTVAVVELPREVAPGESVQVKLAFHARIPRTVARTGFRGEFFFFAHWYPSVGVFDPEGWNCHQFHAGTEFYSDYGHYDVRMTVPSRFVLGASGSEVARRDNGDGTVTHHYREDDIHNFAWTVSPEYEVRERRFEVAGLPPVDMRLLIQGEHLDQVDRHFTATEAALKHYGTWYGAYPYGHVTIVDPAFGSGAGGMEYPTLFTCGTHLFSPFGSGSPEGVTIHEAGHQFWYGLVGNNEFEHAWMDEGLNTFSTARTEEAAFGRRMSSRRYFEIPGPGKGHGGFFPVLLPDTEIDRDLNSAGEAYRRARTWDPLSTPSFRYYPPTGRGLTYGKAALALLTLERLIGWPTLQKVMQTHFDRWKFKHPRPEDFFRIVNEVSGQDLTWFFDQVYRSEQIFDYAIDHVSSEPAGVKGLDGDGANVHHVTPAEHGQPALYRSEVVVERRGGATFPVDVLLVFSDGSSLRERWDGKDRWKRFVEERPVKLRHAIVDPDRVLALDLNTTNNSKLVTPAAELPATKWASRWMIWLQDFLAVLTFFA